MIQCIYRLSCGFLSHRGYWLSSERAEKPIFNASPNKRANFKALFVACSIEVPKCGIGKNQIILGTTLTSHPHCSCVFWVIYGTIICLTLHLRVNAQLATYASWLAICMQKSTETTSTIVVKNRPVALICHRSYVCICLHNFPYFHIFTKNLR